MHTKIMHFSLYKSKRDFIYKYEGNKTKYHCTLFATILIDGLLHYIIDNHTTKS